MWPMPDVRVRRQLERVPFVVAPAAEVDRIARASRLMESDNRREERQARVRLRREELDVAEMGDVAKARKRRVGHVRSSFCQRLLKRCGDVGDEILDRQRARQQALRVGDRDRHLEIAAIVASSQAASMRDRPPCPASARLSRNSLNNSRIGLAGRRRATRGPRSRG